MDRDQWEQLKNCHSDLEVRLIDLRTYLSVESHRFGIRFNSQLYSKTNVGSIGSSSMPKPSTDNIRDNKVSSDQKDALMLDNVHSESHISAKKSSFEGSCLATADPQIKTVLESAHKSTLYAIHYLHRCKTIIQKLHFDCDDVTVTNADTLERLKEIDQLAQNLTHLLLDGAEEMTGDDTQQANETVDQLQEGYPHFALPGLCEKPNEVKLLTGSLEKSSSGESRLSLPRCMPRHGKGQTLAIDKSHVLAEIDEAPCINEFHVYLPTAAIGDSKLFVEKADLASENQEPEVVLSERSTRDEIALVCDSIQHHIGAMENFYTTFDLEQKACLRILENIAKQIQNHRKALSNVTKSKVPAAYTCRPRASTKNIEASVPIVKPVDTVRLTGPGLLRSKLQDLADELHCDVKQDSEIQSSWADEDIYRDLITPRTIPPVRCFGKMNRNAGPSVTKVAQKLSKVIDVEREGCLKIVEELHKAVRARRELIQKQDNGKFGIGRPPNTREGIQRKNMATVRDINWDMRTKLEELNQESRLEFARSDRTRREMMKRNQEYEATVKELRLEVKRVKGNAVETERRRNLFVEGHNARSHGIQLEVKGTPPTKCIGTSQLRSGRYQLPELQIVNPKVGIDPKILAKCTSYTRTPDNLSDKRQSKPKCLLSKSNGGESYHESPTNKDAFELQYSPNREILAVVGVAADGIKSKPKNKRPTAKILIRPSHVRQEHRFRSKPTPHHLSENYDGINQTHTNYVTSH